MLVEQREPPHCETATATEPRLVDQTKLPIEGKKRDLALVIDSRLRGCDVMAIRVDDVAPNRY